MEDSDNTKLFKCRCSGYNKMERRCKQRVLLPIKMKWTCVDHSINYEATNMKESKGHVFFICKKNSKQVIQIRHKFYNEGRIKYLINDLTNSRYVEPEEFYDLPEQYNFHIKS
jgi:hypothetical protein